MEPSPAHSRAEPPPPRRLSVTLGILFVVGLLAFTAVTLTRERPAPLPPGLVGLRFGMTEMEITTQFPDVARRKGKLVRETVAFEHRALCELPLDGEGRLSRVTCHVAVHGKDDEAMRQAAGKALAVARSVYGKESRSEPLRWVWIGTESVLTIRLDAAAGELWIEADPLASGP
ncbi:MAG: hypothetical protein R3B13_28055 [Polyangiaceae bacterium]